VRNYRAKAIKDGQPVFSEDHEQGILVAWLDTNHIFYTHVPNGGWRHPATARRLKRMGVKPGCPDILIFDPSPRHNCPTALELKALDGDPPTVLQQGFMANLMRNGWIVGWNRGADAAIKWLESLGYGQGKTALK
jgi:hypothetical protein